MDKILVVDDEADIVNLVKMVLEERGYDVLSASNGEEALTIAESELPDLVLLDLVMPGKSGLEICKTLKSQPKTRSIPVVIFTALGRDVDRKLTSEAGADAHFVKPLTHDKLLLEANEILTNAGARKFSNQIGMEHSRLIGKKILLEFEPDEPYEKIVRDFVIESAHHNEPVIVLTKTGSTIHQALSKRDLEFVELSPSIRFSAILSAQPNTPLNVICDSLTDLALLEDSEEIAYRFAQNALQVLGESRVTAIFLLNPYALEPKSVASLRGIFGNQLIYGAQGLTVVRLT